MRPIFGTFLFTVVFLAAAAIQISAVAQETAVVEAAETADMQSLFNGTDLDGWEGDERLWQVTDGVIRGETTADKTCNGNTFLIWKDEVADFELRLSFRVSSVNNSGITQRLCLAWLPTRDSQL